MKIMRMLSSVMLAALFVSGCSSDEKEKSADVDELVYISPHSKTIKTEFETAFTAYYKEKTGRDLKFTPRSIDGGSSSILNYLRNVYSSSETSGIDVLWGTGENPHQMLEAEGLLEKLELPEDIINNIPEEFGGMRLRGKGGCWCGNVLSSFGMIYNTKLLEELKLPEPKSWMDMARPEFFGKIMLADPSHSGSMAAAMEIIVQSADSWPHGWEKILSIMGNAKKFNQSSGATADAPGLGESVVAVCIDYYGTARVEKNPDALGYISPAGETGYTPDPISILKNPPHPDAAKMFVEYILSKDGQALWALPVGAEGGPKEAPLNRLPIRKDTWEKYGDQFPKWATNPYKQSPLVLDGELREKRYNCLIYLVKASAIDNIDLLKAARKKVHEKPELMEKFSKLPDDVDTVEKILEMHEKLTDESQRYEIVNQWSKYFRELFSEIANS